MNIGHITRRFLVPPAVRTLIFRIRFGALVSPRAEVDFSPNLELGKGAQISSFCKVKALGGPVRIGARTSIGTGCFVSSGWAGVTIGDHTMIGPNTVIVANNHHYERLDIPMMDQEATSKGITVADDVWIGANCTVLDGANIGAGVIVAAGSVVSGRIMPRQIVTGNPARSVFERRDSGSSGTKWKRDAPKHRYPAPPPPPV